MTTQVNILVTIGSTNFIIRDYRDDKSKELNPIEFNIYDENMNDLSESDNLIILPKLEIATKSNKKKGKKRNQKRTRRNNNSETLIDRALKTGREDDLVGVRQFFRQNLGEDFIWNENTIYEYIGEKKNKYDKEACQLYKQITSKPRCYFKFWKNFFDAHNCDL